VQLNEHKRRMNKKSTKFLRKAHDCILLAVLADWYRLTVAFRGLQMRTQQILLRNVLGAIADTYRVKSQVCECLSRPTPSRSLSVFLSHTHTCVRALCLSRSLALSLPPFLCPSLSSSLPVLFSNVANLQAKKMAIKVGESAFREWHTGLALSSPLKCSSFSSIESQMSLSSLVSNYDAVLEDNGQEVLDRFRENGGSADNCTHTRTHACDTPFAHSRRKEEYTDSFAHSRRKEEYTDSGQEIPFAGLNLCARGPDSVDEAFQSPRDEIQSNSEPVDMYKCCNNR
jgi:hypothetical protein